MHISGMTPEIIPGLPDRCSDYNEMALRQALTNLEQAVLDNLVFERSNKIKLGFDFINSERSAIIYRFYAVKVYFYSYFSCS